MGSAFSTAAPPIHSRSISFYAIRAAVACELLRQWWPMMEQTNVFLQSAIAQLRVAKKLRMRRDTVENWRKSDPIAARKPKSFSLRFDSV